MSSVWTDITHPSVLKTCARVRAALAVGDPRPSETGWLLVVVDVADLGQTQRRGSPAGFGER